MKNPTRLTILCGAVALLFTTSGLWAADEKAPEPRIEKKMRVISGDNEGPGEKHIRVFRRHGEDMPMEKVTFLGVETGRVSPTVAAQLGIPERTGLTVLGVIDESPAAGVLQKHDVLTKFNDQILVNEGQLAVLVRAQKPGDEVSISFLRGGKETKARVKLAEHEVPKMMWKMEGFPHEIDIGRFGPEFNEAAGEWREKAMEWAEKAKEMGGRVREDVERTLRALREEDGKDRHVFFSSDEGIKRVTHINKGRGTIVLIDEAGRVELKMKEEGKHVLVKDKDGKVLFEGPVTNEAERAALSPEVRARLDQVESMMDMDFKWTDDGKAEETSIILPEVRKEGVSFKGEAAPRPVRTHTL